MMITIELSEPAELQPLMQWLQANNFMDRAEITGTVADYNNASWVRFSESALDESWNNPEEDYWDELHAKQQAS